MNLLVTIAYHASNAPQTEKLLDFIYQQWNREAHGHVLLAAAADVHQELRTRIRISAEMAFEGVYEIELRTLTDPQAPKSAQVANAFRQVAVEVNEHFNWPFLWLEPDCTPTCADWLDKIWLAYSRQPKSFFGSRMKVVASKPEDETFFMARVGVYQSNVLSAILANDVKGAFEVVAGSTIVPRLTPTKLFQQASIITADDLSKVRPDAVLVHGDKNGHLLRKIDGDWLSGGPLPHLTIETETFNPPGEVLIPVESPQPEPESIIPVTPIKRGPGRPRKTPVMA